MSIKISNLVLLALFDTLSQEMGEATLELSFEDLGLERGLESHFDTMCLWAINEGLITVTNSDDLTAGATKNSYLQLKAPCLTSLGIAVGTLAANSIDGDIILATAVLKNPGISHIAKAGMALES